MWKDAWKKIKQKYLKLQQSVRLQIKDNRPETQQAYLVLDFGQFLNLFLL